MLIHTDSSFSDAPVCDSEVVDQLIGVNSQESISISCRVSIFIIFRVLDSGAIMRVQSPHTFGINGYMLCLSNKHTIKFCLNCS